MTLFKELRLAFVLVLLIIGGITSYSIIKRNEIRSVKQQRDTTVNRIVTRNTAATLTLLTLDEAKSLHASKKAVFIDARSDREYDYAHIPNAVSAYYSDAKSNPQIVGMDRNQLVVTYCNSPKCPMAELLATKLNELGFTKIFVFPGGMQEWIAAKLPVQSSQGTF